MVAPDPNVTRPLECGESAKLVQCSHLAMRVWHHLFFGPDSERAGVVMARPSVLQDDLDSSKRAVLTALAELRDRGLIQWEETAMVACRDGFVLRHFPSVPSHVSAWRRGIESVRDCLLKTQQLELFDSQVRSEPRSKTRSEDGSERSSEDGSARARVLVLKSDSPEVLKSTSSVAVAPAPVKPSQTDFSLQQDEPKATPKWSKAGQVAALWNEMMIYQVPCKPDKVNSGVLAAAFDSHGLDGLRELFQWANTDDWMCGRKGKTSSAQMWLSKGNLATVEQRRKNAANGQQQPARNEPHYDDLGAT